MSDSEDNTSSSNNGNNKIWSWRSDRGSFEPFKDYYQDIISEAYGNYLQDKSKNVVILKDVIRFVDDLPQDYEINFDKMEQINLKTKFARKIAVESKGLWQFYDNGWNDFGPELQNELEKNHENNQMTFSYLFKHKNETYEYDLNTMSQTNKRTGQVRKIKRS